MFKGEIMFNIFSRKKDDEIEKLKNEVERLRHWLIYIQNSDAGVVPAGFHSAMAEKALDGGKYVLERSTLIQTKYEVVEKSKSDTE
jgi:hypothetical protein